MEMSDSEPLQNEQKQKNIAALSLSCENLIYDML